ncbi:hypothetical protein [Sphingobium sp. R-7]|uniref:hypothetical protein n=1 Tax=Sphingobium sp. R-7 TaxID=3375449 RepID=UPI00398B1E0F
MILMDGREGEHALIAVFTWQPDGRIASAKADLIGPHQVAGRAVGAVNATCKEVNAFEAAAH